MSETSFSPFDLTGRVAVVTGASRGIGRSLACALDQAGARVALVARSTTALEEVAAELGNDPIVVTADLTQDAAPRRVADQVAAVTDGVDILINNSGVAEIEPALHLTMDSWDHVHQVNLRAAFLLAQAFAPSMIERGSGKIVNVGSVMSFRGDMNSAAYAASKAGLLGLTRSLAVEWARHGIQVNALCPGWIETEMTADLQADERFSQRVLRAVPQRRWGHANDLDAAAVFLCCPGTDYLTGQALVVDGGLTAGW